VDASVEGVHFDRRWLSLAEVGARAFHAALSDLAAMGARPVAALSSLVVPPSVGASALRRLAAGQAEAARELRCPVVGGNLSRGRELSVTTTAIGVSRFPLTRAGARAGDEIWLVGAVGLAAAGLAWLRSGGTSRSPLDARSRRAVAACVGAWKRPTALVRDGLRLAGAAHAAIDVSDGLAGDVGHLAEASGVRLVVEAPALRRLLPPALLRACEVLKQDALSLALSGGEDYALVATGPSIARPRRAHRIGRVEKGSGACLEAEDGKPHPLGSGFDHFSGRS
jgi:thiamine-monophosphate kinase